MQTKNIGGMGRSSSGGIRSLRTKAKLKLGDLASQASIPLEQLKRIERGLAELDDVTARALAQAMHTEPETVSAVHAAFLASATPGEGYTTSRRGDLDMTAARSPVPKGDSRRRVLDLFCGAGGLSYGFERAGGFVTVGGIDLLPDRIATFTANHEHAVGLAGDIRETSPALIREAVGDVDVIVGGPPCQGFSSIRPFRTLTETDRRNNLVEHYVLMLAGLRPRWFVFENVVGLVTHEGGDKLRAILDAFSEMGYTVSWRIVNAASFGVPQNRERVVIVGNRLGIDFAWPTPTHYVNHRSMAGKRRELVSSMPLESTVLRPAVTLIDAIGDLPPVESGGEATSYACSSGKTEFQRTIRDGASELTWHRATKHSDKMMEIIRHAGSSIKDLPPGMVTSGFSSCYSRLDAHRPSNTITVNFVHPSSNRCIHPYQDRALTPREGARLQSFPDTFTFVGTTAQVVKQIGNAVPPALGTVIAEAIRSQDPVQMPRMSGQRALSK
ncbi:DNA (cytosine-5-)-methyltransferase [Burkholderia multivorans]|uniref:DNA (cytosine-5-)-methyltransferase n=1 Tax=Burkholderia multivorans TaxID=87883 RepID=UPI001ABA1887|nr:DNA (cytosine-5-)-methyltransferase [Burkholderia multivorans]